MTLLCRLPRRRFSLLSPPLRSLHSSPADLSLSNPTFTIWGSNTGVGKTLVSAGLASSILSPHSSSPPPSSFLYLKPVQTGFPLDSDSRFVFRKVSDLFRIKSTACSSFSPSLLASNQTINTSLAAKNVCSYEELKIGSGRNGDDLKLVCKTLYAWKDSVSPHLAVEREGMLIGDSLLRQELSQFLGFNGENSWRVIETAGGIASPGPSGTLQCDLYRPFRLPAVLVGDGRLGGISATISAFESLTLRGYDVSAVIFEDNGLSNEIPLLSYMKNRVPVLVLPPIPKDPSDDLTDWFCESASIFVSLRDELVSYHSRRIDRLSSMQRKAKDLIWWPFTQHELVPIHSVTVIDSRCGENFSVYKVRESKEMIIPQFDACASWWTQGPDLSLQTELARDMAYSAARYGHVMFPENVYEPALRCAELLLQGVGKGWASRTFYSDNGSTSIEIALKMGFRKFAYDHGIILDWKKGVLDNRNIQLKVLALNGSYHGDTLGAMEAQAPSSYTSFFQQPWYSGRGIFLNPPTVFMIKEMWTLCLPDLLWSGEPKTEETRFHLLSGVFCRSRDSSNVAEIYRTYISEKLLQYCQPNQETRIGALIIEPVIQGAGGMHMIDPLFQRILVTECKNHKIPVIFDEVFTGFWRLGRESAAELLGCVPDIACYAKLMTGGIIPLAVTLTTEAVFDAFRGDSKLMALLHGHSYSAHAMGCTAAAKSIQWFRAPSTNPNLNSDESKLKELWDGKLVYKLSSLPNVKRVVVIGTLCAIELKAEGSDEGYGSMYAGSLVQQLREDGIYIRPLGNVIYLMCGPCTPIDTCAKHLQQVYQRIHIFNPKRAEQRKTDGNSICKPQSLAI